MSKPTQEPTFEQVAIKIPTPPFPTKMRLEQYFKLLETLNEKPSKRIEVMKALNAYKRACDKAGRDLKIALQNALK